jgi:ribosomal protein S18 acetylase RimI-like enzyme
MELRPMIDIRPLAHLDIPRFREIGDGYTSPAHYVITKSETPDQTIITLDLVPYDEPFVKVWEDDEEAERHYLTLPLLGFSFGAYDGDLLVGLALAEPHHWNRSLLVWEFLVHQRYRGHGTGSRMMERVIERGREAGFRVIVCETQNTNVPAIRFYRRMGFQIDSVDLSLYSNHDIARDDVAIFMKLHLD